MPNLMTSRERMTRALKRQEVDHVPCAFMSFSAMRGRCQDAFEVAERELAMGLDSMLFIPSSWRGERPNHPDLRGLPVRLPPAVKVDLWIERLPGEPFPILHKEYHTPAGTLTTLVRKTEDWPYGNAVPLMGDYQIPRAVKPLITSEADLRVLQTILQPPSATEIAALRAEMEQAHAFSAERGVMVAGGWGVAVDMVGWLCGLDNMVYLVADQPQFVEELLATIAAWNGQRMRAVLEAGVDLFIRRAWYESADFWSPRLHRQFLLPNLQKEVALAHEYGTPFGYVMTSNALPMLDNIREAGVDVLLGIDPLQQGEAPLVTMRDKLGGRVCLWGGVNGAITVEEGTEDEVRSAVAYALETMRGVDGFILSPVDNITEITPRAWRNVDVFVKTWAQGVKRET